MNGIVILGIDISKNFSDLCALSSKGDILLETKVYYYLVGLQYLEKQIDRLSPDRSMVTAVMESTAHYHRILENYLRKAGVNVVVINPLQSGNMKNLEIRKIKSDRTDAKRLAQLFLFKMLRCNTSDSETTGTLKDLTRQRADVISERTKYSNKLTAQLDQSFPGFRKVFCCLKVQSALAVLSAFPCPQEILQANPEYIAKTISVASGKRMDSRFVIEKTKLLIATAQVALNIRVERNSFSTLIALFAEMLIHLQKTADEMARQIYLVAQNDACFWESVALLTSIPGIGKYSAIAILAEIGDFSRFAKPKQLIAFAGMDPAVKQSGTSVCTHNKLTKRGSSYLRSILDTCVQLLYTPERTIYRQIKFLRSITRRNVTPSLAMLLCVLAYTSCSGISLRFFGTEPLSNCVLPKNIWPLCVPTTYTRLHMINQKRRCFVTSPSFSKGLFAMRKNFEYTQYFLPLTIDNS